jgi:fibronectin-binding autotransporter adhesin
MNVRMLAFGLALLAGAHVARAEITLELIDRGAPSNGSITATGFTGYTIRLTTDAGKFAALDLTDLGGITGPLVQRWSASNEDGVYDTPTPGFYTQQNLSPAGLNFDSHFLALPSSLVLISPAEDAAFAAPGQQLGSFPVNTLHSGTGLGSSLSAVYGIPGNYQSASLDVAYVVIPNSGTIELHGWASLGVGSVELNSASAWSGTRSDWNAIPSNRNWNTWGHASAFIPGLDVQFTNAGLSGGGAVQVDPAGVTPKHLTVSNASGQYRIAGGTIHASGNFVKRLGGTVSFDNPASFAGQATVSGGTMYVNNAFSAAGLKVHDATLAGTGSISGAVEFYQNSRLAPGAADTIGSLTIGRFGPGAYLTLAYKIGQAGSDRLIVSEPNSMTLSPRATVAFTDVGGAGSGTYTLLDYSGTPLSNSNFRFTLDKLTLGPLSLALVNNTSSTSVDVTLTPTPSWQFDGDGSWQSPGHWSGGLPNARGATALFGASITAPRTVPVEGFVTVGAMRFDSSIPYTIGGTGRLIIDAGTFANRSTVEVASGRHTISTPMSLVGKVTIDVAEPDGELTVSGWIPTSSASLTKTGAGTLRFTAKTNYREWTRVEAGTLIVNGTHEQGVASYTIASGATLGGSGTINTTINLLSGARISPGEAPDVPATLTVDRLTLDESLLAFDIAGSVADRIVITDADKFLLDDPSIITIRGAVDAGIYALIDYNGAALSDVGRLVLATEGSEGGLPLSLLYNSANTSIELVAGDPAHVPEPSALLFAQALLALRKRRR